MRHARVVTLAPPDASSRDDLPPARDLLAAVLGSGLPLQRAHEIADALLRDWGGLHGLSKARAEDLMWTRGVGPAKASALVAAFTLARRALSDPRECITLTSPEATARVAFRELGHRDRECLLLLVANANLRLIHTEIVATGTADWAPVSPSEVLGCVLRHKGRAFALAHNHPSGEARPSVEDGAVTSRMATAGDMVGLLFLHHVVIGERDWCKVEPGPEVPWFQRRPAV